METRISLSTWQKKSGKDVLTSPEEEVEKSAKRKRPLKKHNAHALTKPMCCTAYSLVVCKRKEPPVKVVQSSNTMCEAGFVGTKTLRAARNIRLVLSLCHTEHDSSMKTMR